ncbi:MAG: hypothetical protein ACYC4H_08170 [Desulfocucumaceae bacterium]
MSELSRVSAREDIIPENLEPMGTKEQVISRFKSAFKSFLITQSNRIVVRGGDFDIHFDIGEDDPVRSVRITTNGEIYVVIELLYEKYKWKAFDLGMNGFVEISTGKQKKEGRDTVIAVPGAEAEASREKFAAVNEPLGRQVGAFAKYLAAVAAALVLESLVRPHLGESLAKGLFSTFISVITLYILYRFGRYNGFVGKRHALLMSITVNLVLFGLNIVNNWETASKIQDSEIIKALAFAFALKAGIYYLFIFLGIKIRQSKEDGEQTLVFKWQ